MKWVKVKTKLNKEDWHLWFAWRPVTVHIYPDGNEKKAWMTKVLRRLSFQVPQRPGMEGKWVVEYKELPEEKWVSPNTWELKTLETTTPPQTAYCVSLGPNDDKWERTEFITPKKEDMEGRGSHIISLSGECESCNLYQSDQWHKKLVNAAQKVVDEWDTKHPCEGCEYKDGGGDSCLECMEVDHYEPCSNCGNELDENADCTNEDCPLSTDEWKRPNLNMTGEGLDHQTKVISADDIRTCNICKRPRDKRIMLPDGRCYDCRDKEVDKKKDDLYNHPVEVNWRKKHGKTIV